MNHYGIWDVPFFLGSSLKWNSRLPFYLVNCLGWNLESRQWIRSGFGKCCFYAGNSWYWDLGLVLYLSNSLWWVLRLTFYLYWLSSKLHCHHRFSGSWEREIAPLGQIYPSQPPAISSVSRPHYRLSRPTMIPAGFLSITVYSPLGLPSLRMAPYHSAPPTPR